MSDAASPPVPLDQQNPLPASPTRPPIRSRRWVQAAAAFALYLVVSLILYAVPVWGRFSRVFVGDGRGDSKLYVWALRWWPYAVEHGLNPLHPNIIWAPQGINMAWVTGIPGPAFLMWPVTSLFGPVVASNILAVLSPPLAAWAAYLMCRRATVRFWPALAGAYLFGFSTYQIAQMRGHVNLFLVFPVPLVVYLVVRYIDGSLPGGRFVALLAAVLVLEFSISTEVFTSMTLFGWLAVVGAWWRLNDLRPKIGGAIVRIGLAYVITGVIVSPYLFYAITGIPNGSLRPIATGGSSVDGLSFLLPRLSMMFGHQEFRRVTSTFQPNLSEDGAYLSPVLIVLLILARYRGRRDRCVRLVLGFACAAAVASLGAWLHIEGRKLFPLPWAILVHVPILQDALPQRFTIYMWLAIAVVVGRWIGVETSSVLDPPVDLAPANGPVRNAALLGRLALYSLVAASAVMLLPNLFAPDLQGSAAVPAFFSVGTYRQYLPQGSTVLLIHPAKGQDMLWQETAGFWFDIAQGHTGTEPDAFRHDPVWEAVKNNDPQYLVPSQLSGFLRAHEVSSVVVDDPVSTSWGRMIEAVTGSGPLEVGGIDLFRVPPGH